VSSIFRPWWKSATKISRIFLTQYGGYLWFLDILNISNTKNSFSLSLSTSVFFLIFWGNVSGDMRYKCIRKKMYIFIACQSLLMNWGLRKNSMLLRNSVCSRSRELELFQKWIFFLRFCVYLHDFILENSFVNIFWGSGSIAYKRERTDIYHPKESSF